MNILALDYGQKNIGMAWVDTDMGVVLPFGIVKNQDETSVIQKLSEIVQSQHIEKIIVGLPLGMDGGENLNTERVRAFGQALGVATEQHIEYIDERFTSKQADAMGGQTSRDEKSAMIILQSYIEKVE